VDFRAINIIGCGRLGKSIGKLVSSVAGISDVRVCNSTFESSERAVSFIGSGAPVCSIAELPPSPLWMIASPDPAIQGVAQELARHSSLREGDVLFHCSGALSSQVLEAARERGADVASVHPIRSFAEPSLAVDQFRDTYCAVEGGSKAVSCVQSLFERIGARVFQVDTEAKVVLHVGHVFSSNYIVTILECAERLYAGAGISPEVYRAFMAPLVQSAVDNSRALGTARALTGPISRGDEEMVSRHIEELRSKGGDLVDVYVSLAIQASYLAGKQGLDATVVHKLIEMLKGMVRS
jgi:predicted short-subunit dehydrogenase-like oxidoreductase (DUF2520 family)